MNKINMLKKSTGLVASIGVGAVVANAVKATSPTDPKIVPKILIGVGGYVLGCILSDKAAEYTDTQIDEVVDAVSKAKSEMKNAQESKN